MWRRKALHGPELWARARHLGISFGALEFKTPPGANPDPDDYENEYEIQGRIMEFERHRRESMVAIVAIIASVAALVSAAGSCHHAVR
jgi:hypothetical protein